jgi:DNA end-binding protein Ku
VCEQEVPFDEIVRGYEYEKDNYVVLTDDELDRGVPQVRSIDILKFVDASEIDPIYWKSPYFLAPDGPAGIKAYKLLAQALQDDARVAIAKVAFRDKEHLATVRVRDGVFVLETMFWPDEIRDSSFDELDADVRISEQELKLAKSLVDNLTGEFDPAEFKDEYREKLEHVVEQKVAGQEIVAIEEPAGGKVLDLLEALKASVEQTAGGGEPAPKKKPSRKQAAS